MADVVIRASYLLSQVLSHEFPAKQAIELYLIKCKNKGQSWDKQNQKQIESDKNEVEVGLDRSRSEDG